MRSFWKILVAGALSLGGYGLYKKYSNTSEKAGQADPQKNNKTPSQKQMDEGEESNENFIERLSEIDGVTRRVAGNLVKKGIYTREALIALSEQELRAIKGIGPKRAAKILKLDHQE